MKDVTTLTVMGTLLGNKWEKIETSVYTLKHLPILNGECDITMAIQGASKVKYAGVRYGSFWRWLTRKPMWVVLEVWQ